MTAAPLSVADLSKRYGSAVLALDRLTLEIPAGSISALVGPNGAGKSTLIRTWMGFERPSDGTVSVLGIDPWRDHAAALGRVAYLAQAPAVYAELSVEDHLDLTRHFKGKAFDQSRAERRLSALGIPLATKAGHLSGGQMAQLGLALAIGMEAEVLLLDEPLAHLDPLARREFIASLTQHVVETGATAVLSSHIVSDIERACDRLLLLESGRLRLQGEIMAIMNSHWLVGSPVSAASDSVTTIAADPQTPGISLVHALSAPVPGAQPAPLEDIVIGYLASPQGVPG